MSKTVWHKGPPPSIGWWPASVSGDKTALRWWNGKVWSDVARRHFSKEAVAAAANSRFSTQAWVLWADRPAHWPERSRT